MALWVVAWCAASFCMTLLNKAALYAFPRPMLLVALQMSVALTLGALCRPKFGAHWRVWLCSVPPLQCALFVSGMYGLQHATVASFVVVRSVTPLLVLALDCLCRTAPPSRLDAVAASMIVGGAVVFERENVAYSPIGCVLLVGNAMLGAACRLVEKALLDRVDADPTALVVLNNAPGPFALCAWAAATREPLAELAAVGGATRVVVAATCLVGMLLNYAGMRTQARLSAVSMSVLQAFVKLCLVLVDVPPSRTTQLAGAAVSLGGCVLHACTRRPPTPVAPLAKADEVASLLARA